MKHYDRTMPREGVDPIEEYCRQQQWQQYYSRNDRKEPVISIFLALLSIIGVGWAMLWAASKGL